MEYHRPQKVFILPDYECIGIDDRDKLENQHNDYDYYNADFDNSNPEVLVIFSKYALRDFIPDGNGVNNRVVHDIADEEEEEENVVADNNNNAPASPMDIPASPVYHPYENGEDYINNRNNDNARNVRPSPKYGPNCRVYFDEYDDEIISINSDDDSEERREQLVQPEQEGQEGEEGDNPAAVEEEEQEENKRIAVARKALLGRKNASAKKAAIAAKRAENLRKLHAAGKLKRN